ncbi:K Homology domain-containing protein [Plasmodiophora brassicae]
MSPSMSRSRSRSPYGRSRSRSRSASPDGRRSRSPRADRGPCDVITLTYDEVGFVLGKLGSTKRKIERVSGARLDLHERDHRLEIFGSEKERSRAAEYTRFVLDQRTGDVQIDLSIPRDDLSIVDVPTDTVGFVMGRGGAVLRGLEDEWGTLMFFAKGRGRNGDNPTEKLAIFGSRRSRRGAELKVLSAVEHKHAGFFLSSDGELHKPLNQPGDDEGDDWGYDTRLLQNDEFSYALGARGTTRKKLAAASGAILEFVGFLAIAAGTRDERRRAMDYLDWLLKQRRGGPVPLTPEDLQRDDITVMEVPSSCMGFITGRKGESLRSIEQRTTTFCFGDGDKDDTKSETEKLYIFSYSKSGRKRAVALVQEMIDSDRRRGGRGGRYSRSRSPPRHRDRRSRSRSPRRYSRSPYRGGYSDRDRYGRDDRDRRDRYDRHDRHYR